VAVDQVSLNDGLDGRETVAFGLGAAEVAVFVLALLTSYAAVRSDLPGAVAGALAGLLVAIGALLAWGRMAGRSMLEWAILLARFAVRTQRGHAVLASQAGAVLVPLALRRHRPGGGMAVAAPRRASARVEAFFSLSGGSGRTTLAVEVAALVASRGTAMRASGGRGARVALLDLAARGPAVALRLGLPVPPPSPAGDHRPEANPTLVSHASGLAVHTGAAVARPPMPRRWQR
jgi:Flp pilus assembly CpaE family ATPase